MNQKTGQNGQTMGFLFTMLLFLVFVLSALFTVLTGSRVYENIVARSDASYETNTALSYIANKVRQGDRAGSVNVTEVEGTPVLELKQEIGDAQYVTWIYWQEGKLRELFTDTGSGLGLADGLEILECEKLEFSEENGLLHMETQGGGGAELNLSLRTEGVTQDE